MSPDTIQTPLTATTLDPDPAHMPLDSIETELCTLAGQIASATCRFLLLLADFDAREGWAGVNIRSCAHWLSWRCGLDLRTAREHLRVARALKSLPRLSQAFAHGRISYSKVRAIARVATADNETDLLDAALHSTAAQIERLSRGLLNAQRDDDNTPKPSPFDEPRYTARGYFDDDGSYVFWGRLHPADGARLIAGLTRAETERLRTLETSNPNEADANPKPPNHSATATATATATPSATAIPSTTATPSASAAPSTPATAIPSATSDPNGVTKPKTEPSLDPADDSGKPPEHVNQPSCVLGAPPSNLGPALVAMAEMACAALSAPTHAPNAEVVVHVDAETLFEAYAQPDLPAKSIEEDAEPAAQSGQPAPSNPAPSNPAPSNPARLQNGPALYLESLRELADHGRLRTAVIAGDGRTLNLGRAHRAVSPRQLQALWMRDHGCAVPGCGRIRFLHAHHVVFWARGGRTDLDNLVLLCGEHHRALHDGKFSIRAQGEQRFTFHTPSGTEYQVSPEIWGTVHDLRSSTRHISAENIIPDWDGSPLKLHWAVGSYLENWSSRARRAQTQQAADGAATARESITTAARAAAAATRQAAA